MNDTPLHVSKQMSRMMAQRTPTERLKMASRMFDAARALVAGDLDEDQLRAHTFLRMYGDCFNDDEIAAIMRNVPNMRLDLSPK